MSMYGNAESGTRIFHADYSRGKLIHGLVDPLHVGYSVHTIPTLNTRTACLYTQLTRRGKI